jgi:HTH-type transcriptional regulator/antitoxin HigA
MEIKPIETEQDYQQALAEIEQLMDAQPGTPAGDRLDVVTTLVEAYKPQHFPVPLRDRMEALLYYYLDSRGLSRVDLELYIGSRARVAEVLNRRRALSIAMIRRLHQGLGIPLEVLIRPYALTEAQPEQPLAP